MRFGQSNTICGVICAIHLSLFGVALGSYFYDATPKPYHKGDILSVEVKDLTSLRNWIPISYYPIPHCQPEKIEETAIVTEVTGACSEKSSLYKFKMLEPEHCRVVCRAKLDAKSAKELKEMIADEYSVNMILDDLPLIVVPRHVEKFNSVYQLGFNVGFSAPFDGAPEKSQFISNHLSFTVKYNKNTDLNSTNIVGFEVKAYSVHHYETTWGGKTGLITCELHEDVFHLSPPQEVMENEEIIFTYDVKFQESDVKWESRWESYAVPSDSQSHWLSILSSLVFVAVLSVKLGRLLLETRRQDSSKLIKLLESQGITQEETRTSVNNNSLSPPSNPYLFCVCIGTGIQILGAVLGTLISAALGFLSPSCQGCLAATMLVFWVFMGLLAGFSSTWLHKLFQGRSHWTIISLTTAVAFPTAIFIIYSALDTLLHREISLKAANCFVSGSLLWIPSALAGGYLGSQKTAYENQTSTERSNRLPNKPWTISHLLYALLGGIVSFSSVDAEIFYILQSIHLHQFYSSYPFLLLAFILLVVTCALTTILHCYDQISNDGYHCSWQPFHVAGSATIYFLLNMAYVLSVNLHVLKPVSVVLYLGYILIGASCVFFLIGTIGFLACFWFSKHVQSAIKTD